MKIHAAEGGEGQNVDVVKETRTGENMVDEDMEKVEERD